MKQYLKIDEWSIIEESFDPHTQEISESIFSIGNGYMGGRANFEEQYSGHSLQGSYMAGVYYPDKTRVGWWKNGYPEYFAKVLNSTNWIGINIDIDGTPLDLAACTVTQFRRVLNMKEGTLFRSFTAELEGGKQVQVESIRIVSMSRHEIGAIRYAVTPLNFAGTLTVTPYLDGDIKNKDSNYDEKFWNEVEKKSGTEGGYLTLKTKKLDFHVTSAFAFDIVVNGEMVTAEAEALEQDKYVGSKVTLSVQSGNQVVIYKYAANVTSRNYGLGQLVEAAHSALNGAREAGFVTLLNEQAAAWGDKWKESDIIIEGDVSAQQAIRFNIFQLNQTYTGEDDRLNIGPKGFTGEKYGGSTYWDTEAYCVPFYLSTADSSISRNLLIYRYKHLEKAKENARKLGFKKGALYPMVTMNGEECHNEWEITFEEIHRNGAIAHAIYNYVNYTGDKAYLGQYGLEVLVEISRFWEERVHYVPRKDQYVMLGVTGPNEYENNVNNNWYTNRIASWTMEYTLEALKYLQENEAARYAELADKLELLDSETAKWNEIIGKMYYPSDEELGIFLQQDGFLDKEIIPVKEVAPENLPLNQKWSWDRILRSCYIKQADVLQGLYFLGDRYDLETKKRNFDFYEPITVHESSLSPCIHAILACELGYKEKAYEMYLRTSRLDLDNYNNDTEDGCHTTSMAGTWMSVVHGFGGLRVQADRLILNPSNPGHWTSYSFKIMFRGSRLKVNVTDAQVTVTNETDVPAALTIHGKEYTVNGLGSVTAEGSSVTA
ncbi:MULTISPECIES: glycoside hydrolase family 65 protein [unclassified Paenibacillus]|uniref:glycoside hydrolase family 65 protein n=1 Tax=unclassified Paenibacillus TaxID=185978 RepID=UPI002406985A|nr:MULTISPECIES: glycoside hydrolase family 65 protein [unclassified Paenibacillus]MDF9841795.1 maltose phosphorylase [Paenibacillus sp. PastF-2]MDF9848524.1 maltose phosphorylase [Paenibacillus sp. PastM-2]MDF9854955.1 maltose phosphorylase [Paenibacillus sp. PastF-1]MDH6480224.1 maltose phosphorylase [Paenibacillus sp. PastH-2]MDH6507792.1 maltose phosphorylase [Paenibacillus sp. PastM-3]